MNLGIGMEQYLRYWIKKYDGAIKINHKKDSLSIIIFLTKSASYDKKSASYDSIKK